MIGVVYLGKNPQTEERLKYIPGRLVKMAKTYREAASICLPRLRNEHFILLYEKGLRNEDVTAITYIKKKCKSIYIILLTEVLPDEERKAYQKCGINDTLSVDASITEINKKIQFISDRENVMFDIEAPKYKILKFKIPLWKRTFDIIFSLLGIIILSPVFIATAIAIKLESKGPVIFKSKRVGTNYTIFNFLKFRSMYTDAEQRLKEIAKTSNQYALDKPDGPFVASSIPLGDEAEKATSAINMGAEMMISDDEVMLVGDDFVVSETEFNKRITTMRS